MLNQQGVKFAISSIIIRLGGGEHDSAHPKCTIGIETVCDLRSDGPDTAHVLLDGRDAAHCARAYQTNHQMYKLECVAPTILTFELVDAAVLACLLVVSLCDNVADMDDQNACCRSCQPSKFTQQHDFNSLGPGLIFDSHSGSSGSFKGFQKHNVGFESHIRPGLVHDVWKSKFGRIEVSKMENENLGAR